VTTRTVSLTPRGLLPPPEFLTALRGTTVPVSSGVPVPTWYVPDNRAKTTGTTVPG